MRFPANLRGWGWAEQGVLRGRHGFRDFPSPFGPERIAQPGQSYSHWNRRQPDELMGQQERKYEWRNGPDGKPRAGPTRQDAGAEGRDAKQHTADQIQHRRERI